MRTAKKTPRTRAAAPTPAATASSPAEIGPEDTIACTRACSPVLADAIPKVPAGYRSTAIGQRRRVLRAISSHLEAEAILALEEIAAKGAALKQDLGELAPDPTRANALFARVQQLGKSIAAQEALLRFHHELEDIALSDAMVLLEAAYREYQHRVAHVPQLAQRYTALEGFFRGRSAAIAGGIARAKTVKREASI